MTRPLKLLILGQDPDLFARPEGAPNDTRERHLAYVRELLRRRPGSEVRIIVHTRRPAGGTYDEPFAGLRIYGTRSPSRLHAPWQLLLLMRAFIRDGWIPDVISCQTGHEEGLLAIVAAPPSSRIQIQVHNHFYGDEFAGRSRVQAVQRWLLRRVIARCDQARVVSAGIERALSESGDIPAERIVVAPVPVVFAGKRRAPDVPRPAVLFVGRLVPQKDLGLWCETARLIHRRMPHSRFVVVGDGPDRKLVERELAGLGYAVRVTGALAYAELPDVYASSSLFLLTSLYEGLGRVVVEAMLAGVPVVSTDIVGPQDLIDDGRTGRLVRRDAGALADACLELLGDPARAGRIGEAGRAWAEANYSFDAVTAKLVDSWEAAASLPKRRR